MRTLARLKRLERMPAPAGMTNERRAALYAQVIARAADASDGAPMPAADWSNADAATVAHRERLLRWIHGTRNDS